MIAEDYRGKGYGKIALKEIIKDAINKKHINLVVSVLPNNKKDIALYKNLNFKPTGIIKDN